jgi:DNA repair photolyase
MLEMKTGCNIRPEAIQCPLAFQVNAYWNCSANCAHCFTRRLNRTWGEDQRIVSIDNFRKQLDRLEKTKKETVLSMCIKKRKSAHLGSHADPYQPIELKLNVTRKIIQELLERGFYVLFETMYTENAEKDLDLFSKYPGMVNIHSQVMPGFDKNWETLEKKQTTRPIQRLKISKKWNDAGFLATVKSEPFISAWHTIQDWKEYLKVLKKYGLTSTNIYWIHENDLVYKRLYEVGIDIEKLYYLHKDEPWANFLKKVIFYAEQEGIYLGMPDYINSGWEYKEKRNCCCGFDVPNPLVFNTITWKRRIQDGENPEEVFWDTYEEDGCTGDLEWAKNVLMGTTKKFYTFKDIRGNPPESIIKLWKDGMKRKI